MIVHKKWQMPLTPAQISLVPDNQYSDVSSSYYVISRYGEEYHGHATSRKSGAPFTNMV